MKSWACNMRNITLRTHRYTLLSSYGPENIGKNYHYVNGELHQIQIQYKYL
jgi:hypothetical protein